jgi:hypothetical protein
MKKIYHLCIIGFLIINILGTVVYSTSNTETNTEAFFIKEKIDINYLKPIIKDDGRYSTVRLKEVNTYLSIPGKPLLPKIVKTIELPFGVKNIHVNIENNIVENKKLTSEIKPAQSLLPLTIYDNDVVITKSLKDNNVYNSINPYPLDSFDYTIGCGLNKNLEPVTFLNIDIYPVQYYPSEGKISISSVFDIDISYDSLEISRLSTFNSYDLVIIAPEVFSDALQPLIEHKINYGVNTILKTTQEIYDEYSGVDKPEQIKLFIKDAVELWDVKYVLLVGGLKSVINARPRDDKNQGSIGWYVPVRYTNMFDDPAFPLLASSLHDPGVISDLYYSDIYQAGGEFSSWDGNDDGIFLALGMPGVDDDPTPDFYPDVSLSRLACRSIKEVNTVVEKIITYESGPVDPSWFKKMIVVSGDGFLDQTDLNIQWDTNTISNGKYSIFAQSSNPLNEYGPIIQINVTKDDSQESVITYSHDDHLNPAIQDAFINGFPTDPVAEIVSISEGDILGNTDIQFDPSSQDYCNEFYFWANVSYVNGILTIRGKSYDPKPYGNLSSIHVWIEDDNGLVVFEDWRNETEMYYEGEWTTGEKALFGRGGALYYMPQDFQKDILWGSNGRLNGVDDVLDAVNKGAGFLFFSGHGSPNVWADQYPGIPGDRGHGSFTGMEVTRLSLWGVLGLFSGRRTINDFFPMFPIDLISNGEKLPIAVVGGCHNSQFNVSMVRGVMEGIEILFPALGQSYMWCHGYAVPESFSWRLIQNPNGGAIASMGNTGLGYGMPGKELTTGGGDSWITIEFFKQYGAEGHDILGDAYMQTLNAYINNFDMTDLSAGHPKTITQWVLLGDPTLKIGGYE